MNDPDRKLRVPRLTPEEVRDTYRTSEAIMRLDDSKFTGAAEEHLQKLEDAIQANDASTATQADLEFHMLLIAESRSPRLQRAFATLLIETRRCMHELLEIDPAQRMSPELHRNILAAVVSGDIEAARTAMRAHNAAVLRSFDIEPY